MDTLRDWLALHRVPQLGPVRLQALLGQFGSARSVLEAGAAELADAGCDARAAAGIAQPDWDGVDRDLSWLQAPGHHLLRRGQPGYPALLAETPDAPALLFVAGDPQLLGAPQIAIVGSRNASRGGLETARAFARSLARAGLVVTSGLARGIDAAAHRGALAGGETLAIAANGLDRVYPSEHRELAAEIVAGGGAMASEFPLGSAPLREHFPRRNRIISGLSVGVLVVEASLRSGSLITARLASTQGREVFAVPGSIHNPMVRGCHRLIRDGAKLVESVDDIFEEIASLLEDYRSGIDSDVEEPVDGPGQPFDDEYMKLLEAMGHDPVSVDILVHRSGLTAESVSSMLLILELHGLVTASPGGIYARADS